MWSDLCESKWPILVQGHGESETAKAVVSIIVFVRPSERFSRVRLTDNNAGEVFEEDVIFREGCKKLPALSGVVLGPVKDDELLQFVIL